MPHATRWTTMVVAASLAAASPLYAQHQNNQGNAQRERRQPNQVPDTGRDDPALAPSQFERSPENLPVTVLADGTVMIQLDDSYMEVSTVRIGADGGLVFEHFTGVAKASEAVVRSRGVAPPATA